jgi:hypothetical protein
MILILHTNLQKIHIRNYLTRWIDDCLFYLLDYYVIEYIKENLVMFLLFLHFRTL